MDADTGTWLREARHARGLDARTLAHAAGVTTAAVEAVEDGSAAERYGRALTAAWTWAIARALGLDAEPRLAANDGREERQRGEAEAVLDASAEDGTDATAEDADAEAAWDAHGAEDGTGETGEHAADDPVPVDGGETAPDAPTGGWDEGTLWLWAPPDRDVEDHRVPPDPGEDQVAGAAPPDSEEPASWDALAPPEPVADEGSERVAEGGTEEVADAGSAEPDVERTQWLLTPPSHDEHLHDPHAEEPTERLALEEAHDDEPFEEERSRWRIAASFAAGFVILVVAGLGAGALIAQLFDPGDTEAASEEELADAFEDADDADDAEDGTDETDAEDGTDQTDDDADADDADASQTGIQDRALGGDPEAAPDPSDTTVQVLDGSGEGSATEVVELLEAQGYQVVNSGRAAAAWDETRLLVTEGAEDAAAGLLAADERFPAAEPNEGELDESVELHIIVGADWPER